MSDANKSDGDEDRLEIKVEIISDTMCPWCWVGKRNLEAALQNAPHVTAQVDWLPFFLDKSLPEEGKPVADYYQGNYGDPQAGERMKPALVRAGQLVGIDFEKHYVHMTHYRPTIRSHRLIEYAKRRDKQNEMVEALFHMYYEQGKHLNSIEHLCDAAVAVGLRRDAVRVYLESEEDEQEIYDKAAKLQRQASGVPTYLFHGVDRPRAQPLRLSGGLPQSSFQFVFEHLAGL